jgi:hypothetical protein
MAEDSKLPNIGGNGFIWILLLTAGTYFVAQHQMPLQGSRPASTERSIREWGGEQLVDARLWQDPFAAVADYLAKSPSLKPENCDPHSRRYKDIETYCHPPTASDALPNLTLVVSGSGSPYWEDQEARRRRRYAVLAGMNAEGFVPDDPQHIGFFWPDVGSSTTEPPAEVLGVSRQTVNRDMGGTECANNSTECATTKPASTHTAHEEIAKFAPPVPYEWFRPIKESAPEGVKAKKGYRRILLLWFDEDALAANAPGTQHPAPLQQFAKLLCPYLPAKGTSADKAVNDVKILGPALSTTLQAMADEVSSKGW